MNQSTKNTIGELLGLAFIFSIVFIIPKLIIYIFYDGNMHYSDYISKLMMWTGFAILFLVIIIISIFSWIKNGKKSINHSSKPLLNFKAILGLILTFIVMPIFIIIQLIPLYKDLPLFISKDFSYCEGNLIKVTGTTGKNAHINAYICNMKFEMSTDLKDSLVPGKTYKVTYLPNSKSLIKFEEK